jgi:hypothetical protein
MLEIPIAQQSLDDDQFIRYVGWRCEKGSIKVIDSGIGNELGVALSSLHSAMGLLQPSLRSCADVALGALSMLSLYYKPGMIALLDYDFRFQ